MTATATAPQVRYLSAGDLDLDGYAATALELLDLPGLWVRSSRPLADVLNYGTVAIVGSRAATLYGEGVANDLAHQLVVGDGGAPARTVVSGGGFGVDQAAHRGALTARSPLGVSTVAVLACGADRAYPAAHRDLLDAIATHGAVVSTYPPGEAPTRERFMERNRLIAALSQAVVVVEAAIRSGSMDTARHAADLGRPVGAVPGPVTSGQSEGCHTMIRTGQAHLVTGAADVQSLVAVEGVSA